jgi:hypothetical protein
MRIFHSEFAHDYSSYAFGHEVHAELLPNESAHAVYEQGFLPRSNDPSKTNWFYLARSVRVPLNAYKDTSENRRVTKKFDGSISSTFMTREELSQSPDFERLFLSYFDGRHGVGVMNKERLDGILRSVLPLRGIRHEDEKGVAGYVIEAADGPYLHYWYSAYRDDLAGTCFGLWMMADAVRRGKKEGREYAYLGTAYGQKGRYKMNFEPLQYWDGELWREDPASLKALIENDAKLIFKRGA